MQKLLPWLTPALLVGVIAVQVLLLAATSRVDKAAARVESAIEDNAMPQVGAASQRQLELIATSCPAWLLPAEPETLTDIDAGVLLESCGTSKKSRARQAVLRQISVAAASSTPGASALAAN